MYKFLLPAFCVMACFLSGPGFSQTGQMISILDLPKEKKVTVLVDGKPFTDLIYPDSLEKPVLFPMHAPDGQLVTRGFPIAPRPEDPTDHPHHIGLWFTYENVNKLDFWNNSFAIPADKKKDYGWIRMDHILSEKSGNPAMISYAANWEDQLGHILLKEFTDFIFTARGNEWILDRKTRLLAAQDISFADAKDGLLGLRVTHELELPSAQPQTFEDAKGNKTQVMANTNMANGNYLTSEGKTGDSAWGTRASWCLMYGRKNQDTLSIAIIDHPKNPGYPSYWHARGYGLFAVNPLGQKIFSNGKENLNFQLKKGQEAVFRYRIVVASGSERLSSPEILRLFREFAKN